MATKKAFVSGHNYIQDIHMEPGVYTVLMKVKSMYGDVCSFALFDGTTWTHYDMDTVKGQWKWAYVTFRILVPMTKINLISRNYSAGLPVYVVEPQIVAGNVPFDAGASPFDIDKTLSDVQADAKKSAAITDKFGTETNGGLISSVLLFLRDLQSMVETAGISGIQGAKKNEVALWGGGTFEEANRFLAMLDAFKNDTAFPTEKLANFVVNHDGAIKLGNIFIDERGVLNVLDPTTRKAVLQITDKEIPTFSQLRQNIPMSSTGNNTGRTLTVTSGDFAAFLPTKIVVAKDGGRLIIDGSATLKSTLQSSGRVMARVQLYRDGTGFYRDVQLYSLHNDWFGPPRPAQTMQQTLSLHTIVEDIQAGTYEIRVKVSPLFGTNTTFAMTTTTMSWNFAGGDPNRLQFGSNGFFGWFGDKFIYFSKQEGFKTSGSADDVGLIGGGYVLENGTLFSKFGKYKDNLSTQPPQEAGHYRIIHNIGHQNYTLTVTPRGFERLIHIQSKSNNSIEIMCQTRLGVNQGVPFDFQIMGEMPI